MAFAELHFHLLPGIDDGPVDPEGSLALARAAVADGSRTVVATPHVRPEYVTDPQRIHDAVAALRARLADAGIALEIVPGGELAHTMGAALSNDALELIAHGPPGRRWVLVEGPFEGYRADFTAATDELRARGFAVLLAHPERTAQTAATREAIAHEVACGTALQLTAESLTGAFGSTARELALRLLRTAPIAMIASDAHGPERMPALSAAVAALSAAGIADPARFADAVPARLLTRGLPRPGAALAA